MSDYTPPPGGTDYGSHPRGSVDLLIAVVVGFLVAIAAYLYYLLLLRPKSCPSRLETLQITAFLFFPFLPIVLQCIRLVVGMIKITMRYPASISRNNVVAELLGPSGSSGSPVHEKAGSHHLLDLENNESDHTPAQPRRIPTSLKTRFLILGITALSSWLAVRAYYRRLHITYHTATYVGALGLDHRVGWLAINTLILTLMTLSLHVLLLSTRDEILPKAGNTLPSHAPIELGAAILIAALIQDILGAATNHSSALSLMLKPCAIFTSRSDLGAFAAVVVFALVSLGGQYIPWRKVMPLLGGLVSMWVVLVATSQLVGDVRELRDVVAGRYRPWNYRWAVRDPPWRELLLGGLR